MDNHLDDQISGHYGWSGLMEAIADEIRGKGIDPERVTVAQLAPVDNYHWHRLAGTLALARVAKITADDRVLDVGGRIGGPARQLAHGLGSSVTVLDITSEYCAVGETLTRWTHLADSVSFVHANALDMPFADGSFDVVWTQHASMNIADKAVCTGRSHASCDRVVASPSSMSSPDPTSQYTFPFPGRAIRH